MQLKLLKLTRKNMKPKISVATSMFMKAVMPSRPRDLDYKKFMKPHGFELVKFIKELRLNARLTGGMKRKGKEITKKVYTKHNLRFERNRLFKNLSFKKEQQLA